MLAIESSGFAANFQGICQLGSVVIFLQ